MQTSKGLGQRFQINRIVTRAQGSITIDLSQLVNEKTGLPIWVSTDSEFLSPVIIVTLYERNPSQECSDIVQCVRNMLYINVYYLRAELDSKYLDTYFAKQQQAARDEMNTRKLMCVIGAGMIIVSPWVGPESAIFGIDFITQAVTGKSMFDWAIQAGMRAFGVNSKFVDSFSFWHFTSDTGTDLILMEAACLGISGITAAARNAAFGAFWGVAGGVGIGGIVRSSLTAVYNGLKGAIAGMFAKGIVRGAVSAAGNFMFKTFNLALVILAFSGLDSDSRAAQPFFGVFGQFGKYLFAAVMLASMATGPLLKMKYPTGGALRLAAEANADGVRAARYIQLLSFLMPFCVLKAYCVLLAGLRGG